MALAVARACINLTDGIVASLAGYTGIPATHTSFTETHTRIVNRMGSVHCRLMEVMLLEDFNEASLTDQPCARESPSKITVVLRT